MKLQIARFSPHQNGKVFGILMAVGALVLVVPFMLVAFAAAPAPARPPMLIFVIAMPILYLVMGYVTVVVGCALYNFMYGRIGGLEFETRAVDA